MANVLLLTTPNPPVWTGNGVASMTYLGLGGEVDWSPDGTKIAFDRRDGDGIYQLHTIAPDGTGEAAIALGTNAPATDRHKGWPHFHASGDWIVCQAEMTGYLGYPGTKPLANPGRGGFCDVWVLASDGSQWWNLTNYDPQTVTGVLSPRFSPDGTKLFWAEKIGQVSEPEAPLGVWRLNVADFAVIEGEPTISNIATFSPGGKIFYESHGFSRDSDKIIFTSDPDGSGNPFGPDIFKADLDGANLVNLTNSDGQWDEHARWANHGDFIAYMSTKPYPTYPATSTDDLRAETYIMDADGSNKRRLTGFNTRGFAEYDEEASVATSVAWNPTGTQLVVCQMSVGASYDTLAGRRLWIVTLNEAYE